MSPQKSEYIPLTAAGPVVEEIVGVCPHASTLHRWASHGLAGVRLKTVFACGSRRTKREWLEQFFHAVAEAKTHPAKATLPFADAPPKNLSGISPPQQHCSSEKAANKFSMPLIRRFLRNSS